MTLRVDESRPVRNADAAEAVERRSDAQGEPAVGVASGSSAVASSGSPDRVAATDTAEYGRIATVLACLTDPMVMQAMARALSRDAQVDQQEDSIEASSERAEAAARQRAEALAEALKKADEAKGWGVFGEIAMRVVAAIVAVVGFVAGAFTGGAGVALAVGLLIVAFGNDLAGMMKEAGVDADVTNAIGLGATAVGTLCTLGAGAACLAGVGVQAASTTAMQAARTAADIAQMAGKVAQGTAAIVGSTYEWEAAHLRTDAEEHTIEANGALAQVDDASADAVAFMESYGRFVEKLLRAVEARDEATRAAMSRTA